MRSINISDLHEHKGTELGTSEWMSIGQDRINQFAEATNDHQWIHVDTERAARELPTKSTIAHGFLSLSLIAPMSMEIWEITDADKLLNYGFNKVRFLNMVPVDSKLRLHMKIADVETLKNGGIKIALEATMEIEGQAKPAFISEFIMVAFA